MHTNSPWTYDFTVTLCAPCPKVRLLKKHLAQLPERRVGMVATAVQNAYRTKIAKQRTQALRRDHQQWQERHRKQKEDQLPKNKVWAKFKMSFRKVSRVFIKTKLEVSSAVRIQTWWRQTVARILLRTLRRSVYTRRSKINYAAAVKIQAKVRTRLSMTTVDKRKRELFAVRIQAVFRGHLGRKEARARALTKHRDTAARTLQKFWRGIKAMRVAQVVLKARRRHGALIIRFQSFVRVWLATKRVEALREQYRWNEERSDCGVSRHIYSIRRKKDKLLLMSAFGSIADPEQPMQRVFAYWCSTRRTATSTSTPRMSGVIFLKMIASLPGIMSKTVDNNRLDIIFERAKRKGQKTLAYNEWVTALQYVVDTRLPQVSAYREARDDHARLLRLIDLCMNCKWGNAIARDVHQQAENLVRRAIIGLQRWRRNQGGEGMLFRQVY